METEFYSNLKNTNRKICSIAKNLEENRSDSLENGYKMVPFKTASEMVAAEEKMHIGLDYAIDAYANGILEVYKLSKEDSEDFAIISIKNNKVLEAVNAQNAKLTDEEKEVLSKWANMNNVDYDPETWYAQVDDIFK